MNEFKWVAEEKERRRRHRLASQTVDKAADGAFEAAAAATVDGSSDSDCGIVDLESHLHLSSSSHLHLRRNRRTSVFTGIAAIRAAAHQTLLILPFSLRVGALD